MSRMTGLEMRISGGLSSLETKLEASLRWFGQMQKKGQWVYWTKDAENEVAHRENACIGIGVTEKDAMDRVRWSIHYGAP